MAQNKVKSATRGTLGGMSLTTSYQAVNSTPLEGACFRIALYNSTNGAVDISFDGVTDNDVVLAGSSIVIDAQTNAQPSGLVALFQKGLVVYAKGAAAAGNIYISGYYVTQ